MFYKDVAPLALERRASLSPIQRPADEDVWISCAALWCVGGETTQTRRRRLGAPVLRAAQQQTKVGAWLPDLGRAALIVELALKQPGGSSFLSGFSLELSHPSIMIRFEFSPWLFLSAQGRV